MSALHAAAAVAVDHAPAKSADRIGWSRQQMADRCAQEFQEGWLVNLGIGIPTLCANTDIGGRQVIYHAENGVIGCGPLEPGAEDDPNLVNAGGFNIGLKPGAAIVDHALSFGIIRSGRVDVTVLGAYEVACNGDFANWLLPPAIGGTVGGAMDLAVGAKRVFAVLEHTQRDGSPRLLPRCGLPLTATGVVQLVCTNYGLFQPVGQGFRVRDLAPGISLEFVSAATGCALFTT